MEDMAREPGSALKEKVLSGLIWTFGERIIAQGVSFVLSIILARILLPEEYGIIAMVMVFINIANVFTNGGFGEALVQKHDSDETDFSTMFFCTWMVSVCIYALLFAAAPFIADFYHLPLITWVLRVLALKIIISSIATIQHAYVQKYMLFKKFFFSTLGGTLLSGIVGILMARAGLGVWALVAQYLSNSIIDIVVLLITVPWRPQLKFSRKSADMLLKFGWKMVLANLVNAIYNEIRSIVIGYTYSSTELAYYNKGNQIPSLAITNIDTAIGNVIFPAMAKAESPERLKSIGRRAMKTTSYIIFPIMVGMMVISKPLIIMLLTERWSPCIIYMQILCGYWMTQPIQTTNWQIIKAMGRSDLCLKLELLKKTIGILMVVGAMYISVQAIAISATLCGVISMVINIIPNKKLISYSISEQIRDILPAFMASVVMGGIVHAISFVRLPIMFMLILQVLCGIIIYVAISVMFKLDAFNYLTLWIRNRLVK